MVLRGLMGLFNIAFSRVNRALELKGFLASNAVYVCTEHTPVIVDEYLSELDHVFGLIRECEDGRPVERLLRGSVCDGGFKRLN